MLDEVFDIKLIFSPGTLPFCKRNLFMNLQINNIKILILHQSYDTLLIEALLLSNLLFHAQSILSLQQLHYKKIHFLKYDVQMSCDF